MRNHRSSRKSVAVQAVILTFLSLAGLVGLALSVWTGRISSPRESYERTPSVIRHERSPGEFYALFGLSTVALAVFGGYAVSLWSRFLRSGKE